MSTLEERLIQAFENSLIKLISEGGFVLPDYVNRLRIDPALLTQIYAKIDRARVVEIVVEKAEQHMATSIFHAMSHEISTDVKKILSNTELREDLRAIIRAKIRESAAAIGTVKP